MKNDSTVMDAIYNAATACTRENRDKQIYAKGVLVGLASGIMSQGFTFEQTVAIMADCRRRAFWFATEAQIDAECVPDCWKNEFKTHGLLE